MHVLLFGIAGSVLSAAASAVLAAAPNAVVSAGSEPTPAGSGVPTVPAAPALYRLPVDGTARIVRRFERPPTPYAAGHRGVDLAVSAPRTVRAPAPGRIVFAGAVGGRGLVVVQHADGVRTEYEPLTVSVRAGATVAAGAVLGTVHGAHGGCALDGCLHWGARRGADYFDPMSLLVALGPVRLLPWNVSVMPAGAPG